LNMDDAAPLLSIAEYLEVDNKSFSVSGIVLDDSKVFIEVNGSPIKINSDNTFNIQGYAPIGKNEIKVTAFDEWNNITRKVVIIERKLDTASTVNAFENLNPDKLYSKEDANRFALIIGIEEYENISDAKYAKRDAQYFIDYAQGAFGVPRNNIKFFFDKNAKEKSRFEIKKWLKQNINDDAEIFVYFSGHGMAINEGKELYLLANDTLTEFIEDTAINRNEIFNDIAKYNPQSVTAFLDTCYSGAGRADGEMLLAMAKGLVVVDENQKQLPDNFTLFTAASAQESAWSLPEAKHGTFSYFLMKGLEGDADLDGDSNLTNGELQEYLLNNVGRYAQQQQTPQMIGESDRVLVKF